MSEAEWMAEVDRLAGWAREMGVDVDRARLFGEWGASQDAALFDGGAGALLWDAYCKRGGGSAPTWGM